MSKKEKKDSVGASPETAAAEENKAAGVHAAQAEGPEPANDPATAKESPETENTAQGAASPDQQLQAQLAEVKDTLLRTAAEYENFRKRSARERESLYAEAVGYAVGQLLPAFDNLERAAAMENASFDDYKKGVDMTIRQLSEVFGKLGVEVIDAAPGTPFDPQLHNAVMHVEDEQFGASEITQVLQKGYHLKGKVIRHAMVAVAN